MHIVPVLAWQHEFRTVNHRADIVCSAVDRPVDDLQYCERLVVDGRLELGEQLGIDVDARHHSVSNLCAIDHLAGEWRDERADVRDPDLE